MGNHLADATSSYLRQHADNPVDWHEWSAQAFAEAEQRNVPILLSVGYASCHWCHVMAHESFEDPVTASEINAGFVPIKVDREERPDVDATYMVFTQALTGSGGWPMTVFLTPKGRPFYAGTYYPPTPRGGSPSFRQVLAAVADAWQRDPGAVRQAAARLTAQVQAGMTAQPAVGVGLAPADPAASASRLDAARDRVLAEIDPEHGGFGGAPKFPPTMVLEFLLRSAERTGGERARDAVTLTLERMARGGIYDQLGGGFARYSVDATWHVPHFEKMLTDNAQLLRLYAHHARLTGSALSERIARETADFLLREMRAAAGGFIASLDADAAGVEGLTYRWSLAELTEVIGRVVMRRAAPGGDGHGPAAADGSATAADPATIADLLAALGVDPARPDPEGEVLRLPRDPADPDLFAEVRTELLRVRARRPQPGRDEIVTVAGNGLAIAALAEAGACLRQADWIDAARGAADLVLARCRGTDGLARGLFRGQALTARAGLADHAGFAAGLAALYQATGHLPYLEAATALARQLPRRFRDDDGYWSDAATAPDRGGPDLLRVADPTDGAVPSGLSAAADALTTVAALTGETDLREAAEEIAAAAAPLADRFPRSAGWHLAVAEALWQGPLQVALAGPAGPERDELEHVARHRAPGGAVLDIGAGGEPGRPLLAGRGPIDGRAAAYVCRGFVCDRPTTDPAEMVRQLRGRPVIPARP